MSKGAAAGCCAVLLATFAALAWTSVRTKSPTFDEPVETVSAWVQLHKGDARMNLEDPPLWKYWAALPNGPDALRPDFDSNEWRELPKIPALQARFATGALWRTPGIDGAAVVNRSRAMMLVVGVLLGVLIAGWAWRLGGPLAGVFSAALFAFDPNFLAHAPLMKNDVAAAFAMLAVAYATWALGRKATPGRVIALMILCGVAIGIKFSCLLLGPLVVVLLLIRAALLRKGFVEAIAISIGAVLVSWAIVWSAYGWRDTPIDTAWILSHLQNAQVVASGMASWHPDLPTRGTLWLLHHHLLPEAWLNGLLFTYATAVLRRGFLLGKLSSTGFWYYFPFAVLVKTPLSALAMFVLAAMAGVRLWVARWRSFEATWAAICVVLPPAVYFLLSLHTNMNIGIRHLLPVYAFGEVAAGVVLARFLLQPWVRIVLVAFRMGLFIETVSAAPNYISFFNAAAGGSHGGLHLLGDSNLDWGQDLPLLAEWQRAHPDVKLYLSYFGMSDPSFYGIRYEPLPGNYRFGPEPNRKPIEPGSVIAISASHLQGISVGPPLGDQYASLLTRTPIAVLGGSIYLYDVQ